MNILELLKTFVCAFIAAFGFGGLLRAPKRALVPSSIIGALGYLCYILLVSAGLSESVAMFISAFGASLSAQFAARRMKIIATVFVIVSMLPLIPGLGLYRAMRAFAVGDTALGADTASQTMILILMIALGVGLGTSVMGLGRVVRK